MQTIAIVLNTLFKRNVGLDEICIVILYLKILDPSNCLTSSPS